jgi:hypothetical protein
MQASRNPTITRRVIHKALLGGTAAAAAMAGCRASTPSTWLMRRRQADRDLPLCLNLGHTSLSERGEYALCGEGRTRREGSAGHGSARRFPDLRRAQLGDPVELQLGAAILKSDATAEELANALSAQVAASASGR